MSIRYFEILRDTSHKQNYIPSGRQLPRTPPLTDVKRQLNFSSDDLNVGCEEPHQDTEVGTRYNVDQNGTFGFSTSETKMENTAEPFEPNSMLKAMKGYQMTAGDLEFIKRMQEEKLIKKYQGDLKDVQRLLKKETMALKVVYDLREKAQAELSMFPSCEDLTEWMKVVLQITSPETDLTDLDAKSLLAMVTMENIQIAMDKKKIQLTQMENMLENKRKKEVEERGWHKKQIASEQLKIQGLMSQLSDLTSELAQQEELYKDLQMQIKTHEEIHVDAEDDALEEMQTATSQVRRGGKERKKVGKATEKFKDAAKQHNMVKTTKDKPNIDVETKQKSEAAGVQTTKSGKASRARQKEVKEQNSNPQSTQAVGEKRKPPGVTQTVAPQLKNQRQAKGRDTGATSHQAATSRSRKTSAMAAGHVAEEAQNAGLRRSSRIASRR